MDDPTRHWELSEADFEERKFWDGYMRAYESIIRATNTEYAPWYVIPADKSWFRDAAASIIMATALERMDPQFPPASVDLSKVELVD
jgi:polyphosphate kinase 2 (PPK2 family)